ncbi:hypothetical protein KY335_04020 [Candidatus Woesearchaeota archaeon]|nr:hypothetical protein [Candidatus Woesearchaeota archaeon]
MSKKKKAEECIPGLTRPGSKCNCKCKKEGSCETEPEKLTRSRFKDFTKALQYWTKGKK